MIEIQHTQEKDKSTENINEDYLEKESKTFFSFIINHKTTEIDNFLLDNKHEIWNYIYKVENDETVLHISIKLCDISILSIILKYCKSNLSEQDFKNFINKENSKGTVAIHYASFLGNIDIIKYLINYGADINAITYNKLDVIHYAAQGNQPNSLVYFYIFHRNKINLEKKDKFGSTPLHWASYSSAAEMAMYLIYFNANINQQDDNGNTPLHIAVIKNNYKMVQKLLQKGALNNIKNKQHQTAKDIALKSKLTNIYELLKNSESCQLCNIKAPIQQKKKSKRNIIIVFFFQILTAFSLICFLFPYNMKNDKNNNNDDNNNIIIYGILLWAYILFTLVFFILYIKLIFMDPGIPKKMLTTDNIKQLMKKKEVKINLKFYCPKCLLKRKKYLKHCVICDQCCEEFDHHCYWVNNCVGKNNYKYFISFLFLSFFDVLLILSICFCSLFYKGKGNYESNTFKKFLLFPKLIIINMNDNDNIINYILSIILIISSGFFLIPQFFLIIIHTKNICDNKKNKKRRTSTIASTTNEDLLTEIMAGSDQEYLINDFGSK